MIEFTDTQTDRNNSDEFYTPESAVLEHIRVSEKYLGLDRNITVATAFGHNNIYTKILKNLGYNVVEYNTFEDYLNNGASEYLIDNPPFSTATKDRHKIEKLNGRYSLLGSGTRLPKSHNGGMILLKQPRITYHNGIDVLTAVFSSETDLIISEYNRTKENCYSAGFISVNLNQGKYTKHFLSRNGMNL